MVQVCRATGCEGIFHAILHVHNPKLGDPKFKLFAPHVNDVFAKRVPVGWQIVTRRSISLILKGANRNGLMYHVCEAVKRHEGDITKFISKMEFEPPGGCKPEVLDDQGDLEAEAVLKIRLDVGLSNPTTRGLVDDLLDLGFLIKKRG